ncbi:MAG TPA: 23S rRNA (guanosine(2251)-2'-O)-methyltransferase RlmB [Thermoanaerobaculia bacterium]|nr:23S rRNA (guanosine(2251)-2'-O)-methyltransferase RlmB [Thermoanaerobaculia bacterium]
MIIYGWNPIHEALRSHPEKIRWIAVLRDGGARTRRLATEAKEAGVAVRSLDRAQLERLVPGGAVHNGVAAELSEVAYASFEEILARPSTETVFLLDGIRDPHNLGAVIRVADALGIDLIVIPEHDSVGLTPAAIKASAGASEWVPVAQVTNLARSIEELKERGFWIYAADLRGEPIDRVDLKGKVAIVLGSEGGGIRKNVRNHCDAAVSIPLRGHVDSLNVSTAAAVLAWEIRRQRGGSEGPAGAGSPPLRAPSKSE